MQLHEVMLIDDSDADLLYTRVIVEGSGVADQVVEFGLAAEALEFLRRPEGHGVDVILLDINMPEMNGFEFLDAYERLHASQQAHAVVVMLTSSPDPGDRARALAYACVRDYVVKPINLKAAQGLAEVVKRAKDGG
jgi:CheY-like chemotaxis protein